MHDKAIGTGQHKKICEKPQRDILLHLPGKIQLLRQGEGHGYKYVQQYVVKKEKEIVLQFSRVIAKEKLAENLDCDAFKQHIKDRIVALIDQIVQNVKNQTPAGVNPGRSIFFSIQQAHEIIDHKGVYDIKNQEVV